MKKKCYIEGFYERMDEACLNSGLSKNEIARRCGFNRKILTGVKENRMLSSGYLARFCVVTKTDANWLLGIKI